MATQKYLTKILTEKLVGNDINLIKNITRYLPQYKYEKNVVCRKFVKYQLQKYGWMNGDFNSNQQLTEFYLPDIKIHLFTIAHSTNLIDIGDILEGALMDIECYEDNDIENAGDLQEYYMDSFEIFYKYSYISKIYEHHQKIIKHKKYLEELKRRVEDLNNDEESSDDESTDFSSGTIDLDIDLSDISSDFSDSDED